MWKTECSLDLSLCFLTNIKERSVERKNRTNVSFLLAPSLNCIWTKQDHLLVIRTFPGMWSRRSSRPSRSYYEKNKTITRHSECNEGMNRVNVSLCSQFAATSGHGLEQNVCHETFVIMIFLMTGAEHVGQTEETLQRSSALGGTIYQHPRPISDCFVSILSRDSLSV